MINRDIYIKKDSKGKPQYLTEVLPMIPTNTILHKTLTGLGATYGELKADRNSIIIEPNKPVIVGKCSDPKHADDNLLAVYKGVYSDDIVTYLERSLKKNRHFKILTTPESFNKVREAFEEVEIDIRYNCFLLFDECHKIIKDVDYRENISLPMDLFFECDQKAMVSATPIIFTDPRFEEGGFQTITIKPNFDYTRHMTIYTTNNLLQTVKELFVQLQDKNTPVFLFCNSTDTIYSFMTQLEILSESAVFCSENSLDKLKGKKFKGVYSSWSPDSMKRFNWLTSRFYNALDIELDIKPIVVLLTDCYFAEYTKFDPQTDAIQCVGRFRNGVSSCYHLTNTNPNFAIRSKDELRGYIRCSEDIYLQIRRLRDYATTLSAKDAYMAAMKTLPFKRFVDVHGNKNYFLIDNELNDKLVSGYYNNPEVLCAAYSEFFSVSYVRRSYKLGDFEKLKRQSSSDSIKEKRKEIVSQLDLLGECCTEMDWDMKRALSDADEFIVNAYDKIGKAEIERLKYNRKKIKEAMILADYKKKAHGTEALQLIYNSFEENTWYPSKFIKDELSRIFKKLDIHPLKAVSALTINSFFDCEESRKNGKRGFLLKNKRFS